MELFYDIMNRKLEFSIVILLRIDIDDDGNNVRYSNIFRSQYGEHVRGEWRAASDDHTRIHDATLSFLWKINRWL